MEDDLPTRRPTRIPWCSYRGYGAYYLTICTHKRRCLLGRGGESCIVLTEAGAMVADVWRSLSDRFPQVRLDEYVVMPNHVHGILGLPHGSREPSALLPRTLSIVRVVQAFKSITTVEYTRGVRDRGWRRFEEHLWQRSFYDHVIRSEDDLEHARWYIRRNPERWFRDPHNPR